MSSGIEFLVTERQDAFLKATCDEVLFGGAAGGGKSHGQLVDAYRYARQYPMSRQLLLRRTMPELERTLIRSARALYPANDYTYNKTKRLLEFSNKSTLEFGYCGKESDVYRYQSAEYDVIRFDELTHFTEHMYVYLQSRLRGTADFPRQIKSTTNPGGVGHTWVKRRFVDVGAPDIEHTTATGTRIFLPALLSDNCFLNKADPAYKKRLENLGESERRALLHGDWNIADGRYFSEWEPAVHIVRPFGIPAHWPVYFAMDYGLDMLAGYWIAVDTGGRCYVFREVYEARHIISAAANRILSMTAEPVRAFIAPPDLWNHRQETGRSAADIFYEYGVALTKAPAARVPGWLQLKERLRITPDETGARASRLVFFSDCSQIIRTLPEIGIDPNNPNDCALTPHELTHGPDAIRYFVASQMAEEAALQQSGCTDESLDALLRYGV